MICKRNEENKKNNLEAREKRSRSVRTTKRNPPALSCGRIVWCGEDSPTWRLELLGLATIIYAGKSCCPMAMPKTRIYFSSSGYFGSKLTSYACTNETAPIHSRGSGAARVGKREPLGQSSLRARDEVIRRACDPVSGPLEPAPARQRDQARNRPDLYPLTFCLSFMRCPLSYSLLHAFIDTPS